MDAAITITFYLLDTLWPFLLAIVGLMVGSSIISKIISFKDLNL
jgi:hypothetical protein